MDVLEEAYRKAKANGGAGGVDGETFEDVEKKGVADYLAELQLEMKERRYVPKPVRRVYIPKPNGKQRPLGHSDHSGPDRADSLSDDTGTDL